MPELPEVDVMKTGLEELVVGKTIESVDVYWDAIIDQPSVDEFKKDLVGDQILDVRRRGKYLIFKLSNHDLVSHLRMTGGYSLETDDLEKDKHTHVIFHFEDGSHLLYHDIRKFGRMYLMDRNESKNFTALLKLGPEPTMEDLDFMKFITELGDYNIPIKSLLLDQTFIAGLGNIYADESLFRAKIHPLTPANQLNRGQTVKLYYAITDIIRIAMTEGGSSIRNYKNAFGEQGNFQNYMKVYGKEGEACQVCFTPIEKIKVGQRGTHFCPQCQVEAAL